MLEHHAKRLNGILEAVKASPDSTAYEVAEMVRKLTWEKLLPHQKWFAMGETLAYLYFLLDTGLLSKARKKGKLVYHFTAGGEVCKKY